jgi:hypothetical protein
MHVLITEGKQPMTITTQGAPESGAGRGLGSPASGGAWLDKHYPGWAEEGRTNLDALDVDDPFMCPVAQAAQCSYIDAFIRHDDLDYAARLRFGFHGDLEEGSKLLNRLWREEVLKRRRASTTDRP